MYVTGISLGAMADAADTDLDTRCVGVTRCECLMKLGIDGSFISVKNYGMKEPTQDAALSLAGRNTEMVIVGAWSEPMDFGQGPLSGIPSDPPNQDIVLARFLVP